MSPQYPMLGVFEGFYGKPWPSSSRLAMLEWLAALGLVAYLYAPKADASLRRAWRKPWTSAERAHAGQLAAAGAAAGVAVHVGLSPFALYEAYDRPARAALRDRIREIIDCGVAGVALLFDDMPGNIDALATRQAEIATDVVHWLGDLRLRLCPTYYSDDPVLDRVCGARPVSYLEDLGHQLPGDVALFWTGPTVCADAIAEDHLQDVARRTGRTLALWDNYPVNDSKLRSAHLYLQPLAQRAVSTNLESHWCNAMNQAALSLPALASLAELHGRRSTAARREVFAAAGVDDALIEACWPLSRVARDELDPVEQGRLRDLARERGLAGRELRDWLDGLYRFDPACLTD